MTTNSILPRLILAALFSASALPGHAGDDEAFSDRAAVALESPAQLPAFLADYGFIVIDQIPSAGVALVMLDRIYEQDEFEELLENDPRVDWADLDFEAGLSSGGSQSLFNIIPPGGFINQPMLGVISPPVGAAAPTGDGVRIAVIDTGADAQHAELLGRLLPGHNVILDSSDTADIGPGVFTGHGTFVAALSLLVAPEARVIPIRAMDGQGMSTTWLIAKGIYKAIDLDASIINISLGSYESTEILERAAEAARQAGVVVVAAAGNDNISSPVWWPAAIPSVISVAGTDNADVKAPFSNFGSEVDIAAPAVDIVSATTGGEYAEASGTSWSAALVSGAAALLRQQLPGADLDALVSDLLSASVDIDGTNPDHQGQLGAGRLDLAGLASCPGDFDGDGLVGFVDLNIVLAAFNNTMGFAELNAVLSTFNSACR